MKVAITGATGFVGSRLVERLAKEGDNILVLTRNPEKAKIVFPPNAFRQVEIVKYNYREDCNQLAEIISRCDGVVNLAGEPVAERWSSEHKQEILESRQLGTKNLVEAISKANPKPTVLVNPSAIGYYGTSETATFTENSPPGQDFLAEVCQKWEAEANKVRESGVRLVILRIGIVLGNGGALGKMIGPFKLFAGGPIGSGRQWLSWIHLDDLVSLIITALKRSDIQGTFNATSPNPVRMGQFCQTLGEVMSRPSWLPVPALALEFLLGDGAKVVLEGQQVLPQATQGINFSYQYPDLKPALKEIIEQL
jgi:uncharacterized protein (TIGR01777 family)